MSASFNFFWLYDLPTWVFCALVIGAFVGFGLVGQLLVRLFLPRLYGDKSHNDIVGQYLSASGVFFGVTLGLLSAGAWQNYNAVNDSVTAEATAIASLYRTAENFPEPDASALTAQLRDYTRQEIDRSWPMQQKGENPSLVGAVAIRTYYKHLSQVEPRTEAQKILQTEAVHQLSAMTESRGKRLSSVDTHLPPIVWFVVMGGSALNLMLMWLFVAENKRLHDLLTAGQTFVLGLLVFLLAVMDYPFRGEFNVGPDAFEKIYEQVMHP